MLFLGEIWCLPFKLLLMKKDMIVFYDEQSFIIVKSCVYFSVFLDWQHCSLQMRGANEVGLENFTECNIDKSLG